MNEDTLFNELMSRDVENRQDRLWIGMQTVDKYFPISIVRRLYNHGTLHCYYWAMHIIQKECADLSNLSEIYDVLEAIYDNSFLRMGIYYVMSAHNSGWRSEAVVSRICRSLSASCLTERSQAMIWLMYIDLEAQESAARKILKVDDFKLDAFTPKFDFTNETPPDLRALNIALCRAKSIKLPDVLLGEDPWIITLMNRKKPR